MAVGATLRGAGPEHDMAKIPQWSQTLAAWAMQVLLDAAAADTQPSTEPDFGGRNDLRVIVACCHALGPWA